VRKGNKVRMRPKALVIVVDRIDASHENAGAGLKGSAVWPVTARWKRPRWRCWRFRGWEFSRVIRWRRDSTFRCELFLATMGTHGVSSNGSDWGGFEKGGAMRMLHKKNDSCTKKW